MIHETEIEHYTLDDLAKKIGDLRYDALAEFLKRLGLKIQEDSYKDSLRGRKKLSRSLSKISDDLLVSSEEALVTWEICKQYTLPKEK